MFSPLYPVNNSTPAQIETYTHETAKAALLAKIGTASTVLRHNAPLAPAVALVFDLLAISTGLFATELGSIRDSREFNHSDELREEPSFPDYIAELMCSLARECCIHIANVEYEQCIPRLESLMPRIQLTFLNAFGFFILQDRDIHPCYLIERFRAIQRMVWGELDTAVIKSVLELKSELIFLLAADPEVRLNLSQEKIIREGLGTRRQLQSIVYDLFPSISDDNPFPLQGTIDRLEARWADLSKTKEQNAVELTWVKYCSILLSRDARLLSSYQVDDLDDE